MKYSKKVLLISICITVIVSVLITLAVIFGLQWMPKGSHFSFDTLAVFIGSIGSIGAFIVIGKQLFEQKKMQEQNVLISIEQNELQKQIVKISEEQKEIQRQAIKLDLFDKRFEIYSEIKQFINSTISDGACKNENLGVFLIKTRDADFLFEQVICDYIRKLYCKGSRLNLIKKKYESALRENDPINKLIDEEEELLTWFQEQFITTKQLFDRYINVNKLGLSQE